MDVLSCWKGENKNEERRGSADGIGIKHFDNQLKSLLFPKNQRQWDNGQDSRGKHF
jgi:hypothetical protein